jgi:hypothetical protein
VEEISLKISGNSARPVTALGPRLLLSLRAFKDGAIPCFASKQAVRAFQEGQGRAVLTDHNATYKSQTSMSILHYLHHAMLNTIQQRPRNITSIKVKTTASRVARLECTCEKRLLLTH